MTELSECIRRWARNPIEATRMVKDIAQREAMGSVAIPLPDPAETAAKLNPDLTEGLLSAWNTANGYRVSHAYWPAMNLCGLVDGNGPFLSGYGEKVRMALLDRGALQ